MPDERTKWQRLNSQNPVVVVITAMAMASAGTLAVVQAFAAEPVDEAALIQSTRQQCTVECNGRIDDLEEWLRGELEERDRRLDFCESRVQQWLDGLSEAGEALQVGTVYSAIRPVD